MLLVVLVLVLVYSLADRVWNIVPYAYTGNMFVAVRTLSIRFLPTGSMLEEMPILEGTLQVPIVCFTRRVFAIA
jgi:hypothetical protein